MDAVLEFLNSGNNLWYVVGGVAVVVLLIVVVAVTASASKKKKRSHGKEEAPEAPEAPAEAPGEESDEFDQIDVDNMILTPEEEIPESANENFTMRLPVKYNSSDVDSVVVKPVRKKAPVRPEPAPEPEPAPDVRESSFKEHVYSPEAGKRPGTVQIYIDGGGKYRFRFKTSNGETVGHSQGYTTKSACKSGIKAVENAVKVASVIDSTKEEYASAIGRAAFVVYRDREQKFRFRLTASNTSNILASQGYTSKVNCINGTKSVTNVALFHNVVDDTLKSK